jgi:trimethylamine--corrinoid protein Co-methyltransferase
MGFEYRIPSYEILAEEDVHRIHEKSLDILETIGMRVPHEKALEALSGFGVNVDRASSIARFGREAVLRAVESAGKRHILYGLDRNNRAEFGYGMFNFNGTSGQYQIVDEATLTRRAPRLDDLRAAVKVGNGLENINVVGALVVPQDIPHETVDLAVLYEMLTSTTKPFCCWIYDGRSARVAIEMMQTAAGGREQLKTFPLYEGLVEPVSPLSYRKEGLDILYEFVNAGLPLNICPMVQVGASGPCSISGTIAQENAEILSGIVITQALQPGHPVTYGGIPHVFDMKAAMISFGSPEQALMAAAMTQIGRWYGFPVYNNTGLTDSKALDAQYGIESAATLAFGALAGADIFGHLGISGADNAASVAQLIIDNELAGYYRRIFSGFQVGDLNDAYGEIGNVGIGGNFFGTDMTVQNFRDVIWYPELFDRRSWDRWKQEGGRDVIDAAIEKKKKLLDENSSGGVEEKVAEELKRILKTNGVDPFWEKPG